MRARLGAAVLGVLAGLMLGAGGGLAFLAHGQEEWHRLLSIAGYGVAVGALAVLGYSLAATAPVWLRLIVSVGFPLLAATVWQVVAEETDRRVDGWKAPASEHLAAGLVLLVVGLVLARSAESEHVAATRAASGHRGRHR
jgi:hypothetical protein